MIKSHCPDFLYYDFFNQCTCCKWWLGRRFIYYYISWRESLDDDEIEYGEAVGKVVYDFLLLFFDIVFWFLLLFRYY